MFRRKFLLDTVFTVVFIFGLMGVFSSVTYFNIFDVFDPIGEMFADFDLTDLVMSQLREDPLADEDIVIVNIGDNNREMIASQIGILAQYEPAVIGVDVTFNTPKPYKEDSLLELVLSQTPNVVVGSELRLFNEKSGHFDTLLIPEERLARHSYHGFVNLLTNASSQDDLKSCREFVTRQQVAGMGKEEYAFAVQVAMLKDPEKTQRFLDRGNEIEAINFKGNAIGSLQTEFGTRYFVLDIMDVFEGNFIPEMITGKVVILCYMGRYLGDEQTRTDIYFTPLNKNYVGKAEPDMFGGVVHANIVSMILEEDYVNVMSPNWGIFIAIVTCLVIVFFFKIIYSALPRWYDGITKVIQLFLVIGISVLIVLMFHFYTYKVDLTLTLIVIALSGDSIEVYHGVVKNLFIPRERRKLFQINKHFE